MPWVSRVHNGVIPKMGIPNTAKDRYAMAVSQVNNLGNGLPGVPLWPGPAFQSTTGSILASDMVHSRAAHILLLQKLKVSQHFQQILILKSVTIIYGMD